MSGDPSVGMLWCSVGGGPDPKGKDTDCPGKRDPTAKVAAAEVMSRATWPWDRGVRGASGARVGVIKMDSVTGSRGA